MDGGLFIIAAPSGAGKTSLVRALVSKHRQIKLSVSYTTRSARNAECDKKDYFFVSKEIFVQMQNTGDFLESATVFDNYYGTSNKIVTAQLNNGQDVILEIDWQGAKQVKNNYPSCTSIFILPPSTAILAQRLRGRGQDNEGTIARRMLDAENEILHCLEFDYLIVNDDFELALNELETIIAAKNKLLDITPQSQKHLLV